MEIYKAVYGRTYDVIKKDIFDTQKVIFNSFYNCNKESLFEEIAITDYLCKRKSKRKYGHHIISLPPNSQVTPEQLFNVVDDYIRSNSLFDNRITMMAIHINRNHLHAHIIFQSASFDGYHFQLSRQELANMKEMFKFIYELSLKNELMDTKL